MMKLFALFCSILLDVLLGKVIEHQTTLSKVYFLCLLVIQYKILHSHTCHVIGVSLLSQSASEKHSQDKKPTNLCAPCGLPKKNVSPMFDNHAILLF